MKAETTKNDNSAEKTAASFSALVWSLSASGLIHMGQQLSPELEASEPNLPFARQTIDTLEMLKVKTEGNLSEAEKEMLDEILYQLRLTYVKVEEGQKKTGEDGPAPADGDEPAPEPPSTEPPERPAGNEEPAGQQ